MSEKWDRRFLRLAAEVAQWSKDPSTKVGAVIVRPDRTIAGIGFNGFPRGCRDDDELYDNRELKYERVIHAEMNAILNARSSVEGCTLYTYPASLSPTCARCATMVIQAGISRLVWIREENEFGKRHSNDIALGLYEEAGVQLFPHEQEQEEGGESHLVL